MITSRVMPALLPARAGVSQTPQIQPVKTLPTPWETGLRMPP